MSEVKLLPCPFCGGEKITMNAFDISQYCTVECETCGVFIEKVVPWKELTKEQHDKECVRVLTEAWNTRKPMQEIVERLEADIVENPYASDWEYRAGLYQAIEIVKKVINK